MDARWLQEPAASEQGVAMRADARLRIRTEACLPRRFPAFACRRCADACPSHALLPTPQGPHLSSGCTDCGRCAARCPTEALSVPGFGPVRLSDSGPAAGPISIDCWRVAPGLTPAGGLRVPCLGGLPRLGCWSWSRPRRAGPCTCSTADSARLARRAGRPMMPTTPPTITAARHSPLQAPPIRRAGACARRGTCSWRFAWNRIYGRA